MKKYEGKRDELQALLQRIEAFKQKSSPVELSKLMQVRCN